MPSVSVPMLIEQAAALSRKMSLHEAQIAAGGGDVPLSNSKTLAPSRSLPVLKLVATRCGPDAATASQKIGQFPSMPPRGAAQMRAAPTLDPRPRWLSPPSAAHRMAGPRGRCEERLDSPAADAAQRSTDTAAVSRRSADTACSEPEHAQSKRNSVDRGQAWGTEAQAAGGGEAPSFPTASSRTPSAEPSRRPTFFSASEPLSRRSSGDGGVLVGVRSQLLKARSLRQLDSPLMQSASSPALLALPASSSADTCEVDSAASTPRKPTVPSVGEPAVPAYRGLKSMVRKAAATAAGPTVASVATLLRLQKEESAATAKLGRMKRTYLSSCEALNQKPASRVLRYLGAPRLSLRHYGLSSEGTAALARLLPEAGWRALSLADNSCTDERGAAALALGLRCNTRLTELDLSRNRLGARGAALVLGALSTAAGGDGGAAPVATLRFGGNALGDGASSALGRLVSESLHLHSLVLSDNKLRQLSAATLADGLRSRSCVLTELDISWNMLLPPGVAALAAGLRHNTTLLVLDMSWNGAGAQGGVALAEVFTRNKSLRSLKAAHNGIGTAAAVVMAHALGKGGNRGLTALDLSDNPLGRAGVQALMRSLGENDSLVSVNLLNADLAIGSGMTGTSPAVLQAFDPNEPQGIYNLDLSAPWDRWVACKLRDLSIRKREPWRAASYDAGDEQVHWSWRSTREWSEKFAVPTSGQLRLEYVRATPRARGTTHYCLRLDDAAQREVAQLLWARARAEACENWQNETLDGQPLELNEDARVGWVVPEAGCLELDYVTYDQFYEGHYRLDLAAPVERAIACKLQERFLSDDGVGFVRPTLDGAALSMPAMRVNLRTRRSACGPQRDVGERLL